MNICKYGFVLFVVLLLSACGGGGGGGNTSPPGNTTLSITLASDTPPPRVIAGTTYQEVFAFTVSADTGTKTVTGVSVAVSGDPALVAALSLQLTNSGTPVGSVQQVAGGRALFSNLSVNVASGSAKRFGVLVAVTGNVLWNTGERTKKVSFSILQSDVVAGGTATVTGSATGAPMYRERGRIVFPLGEYLATEQRWSFGSNIWVGDMETLTANALTNDVGQEPLSYSRFGMTPSPSFDRIAFSEKNTFYGVDNFGAPHSIKTNGANFGHYTPRVCNYGEAQEGTYTPDGIFFVYRTLCFKYVDSDGKSVWRSDIIAVRTDGAWAFKVTDDMRNNYSPVVSKDGMAVYFVSCGADETDPSKNCVINTIGVNFAGGYVTETPRYFFGAEWGWSSTAKGAPTEGYAKRWLSLSPDRKKLLVTFKMGTGPDVMGIYNITSGTMTEFGNGSGAYWAADGRITFFRTTWTDQTDSWWGDGNGDNPIPFYVMEDDGKDVREVPVEVCIRRYWDSCTFGLPLLPPL